MEIPLRLIAAAGLVAVTAAVPDFLFAQHTPLNDYIPSEPIGFPAAPPDQTRTAATAFDIAAQMGQQVTGGQPAKYNSCRDSNNFCTDKEAAPPVNAANVSVSAPEPATSAPTPSPRLVETLDQQTAQIAGKMGAAIADEPSAAEPPPAPSAANGSYRADAPSANAAPTADAVDSQGDQPIDPNRYEFRGVQAAANIAKERLAGQLDGGVAPHKALDVNRAGNGTTLFGQGKR